MPATNPAPPHARDLIGGQWVDSPKGGTAYSPATGAVLGGYADAELEHARAAVAARAARSPTAPGRGTASSAPAR